MNCLERLNDIWNRLQRGDAVDGPTIAQAINDCDPGGTRARYSNCSSCKKELVSRLREAIEKNR
jgi:hypothetical protein